MDLVGYDRYMSGNLKDVQFTDEDLAKGLKGMEGYPKPAGKK